MIFTYPMGNKTYAMGDIEISPTLTKADYDELDQYMTQMFGAWPHWATHKPEWDDATIILKNEGEWEKMDDWQEQLLLILKWLKQRDYRVEGEYRWQDETIEATLHIDTAQEKLIVNTAFVKITCPPDWDSGEWMCSPTIEGPLTWPE
jgi:hypothetical protein